MANAESQSKIAVEVAHGTALKQVVIALDVPQGCTLEEAVAQSGIQEEFPDLLIDPESVGIFGKRAAMQQVLQEGDRVEIYRPLFVDPMEARRLRAKANKK